VIDGTAPPPGGVWFCDLSDAEREAEVLDAVSWSLGLSPPPDAPPEEAWRRCVEAAHWRGGLLLVLDNCEHLVEACAGLALRHRVNVREVGLPGGRAALDDAPGHGVHNRVQGGRWSSGGMGCVWHSAL
jgi:hypothetical protein